MSKVKIALLGMGNVGCGVLKVLSMNKKQITQRSGYEIEVGKVLVKNKDKDRNIEIDKEIITTNFDDILNDEDVKIIVELMGGIDPAREYIIKSMKKGKHIVTANKMLIATYGEELFEEAKKNKVMFYYEASVSGGIPIIEGLSESLTANKIERIIGIINGTTNYILSKMSTEELEYDKVLRESKKMGFTESDPKLDVSGYDAAYKLAILSRLAFETKVDINSIYREGIESIKQIDIDYAKEFGYIIKLLAVAKEEVEGVLELRVHPAMIPINHPLANVNGCYNGIFIRGNAVGDLIFYGHATGEMPTSSAVVSDIITILRRKLDFCKQYGIKMDTKKVKPIEDTQCGYYIRITVEDIPGVLARIATVFGKNKVSLLSVIQKPRRKGERFVSLVFFTHNTLDSSLKQALNKIKNLRNVNMIESIIRLETFK
ncbi:homoserine dehydrogenase [Clostridium acetireducens DSM 10703]|uniref:Homoserine dehydrogenase n=1 Tax=Clostridium acetireducens DSM 10703 TaxID=1121290 RepID=A0A1E8F1G2_9CLOT|nr:homoserine dehydrogenase [Clostridium acetireducens]OFI06999.1 homoserine dehydrogenase [Clostridium acetireducens DSM 10703]